MPGIDDLSQGIDDLSPGIGELSRNRIHAMSAPGVAAGNAFYAEPGPFDESMFLKGFYRIMGAARGKPAAWPQGRRDHPLIYPNECYQWKAQEAQDLAHFTSFINFCKSTPIFAFTVP
jgi:hypothetical protein